MTTTETQTTTDYEVPQTERVVNEDGTVTVIGYPSVGVRPKVGDGTSQTEEVLDVGQDDWPLLIG